MCAAPAGGPGSTTRSVTLPAYEPATAPARADGAELIGEFESSGYREPPALVRRADGQVARLHPVLYEVAKRLDGRQPLPRLARAIARETGIELTADQIGYLVDSKLAPLGISNYCDGSPPAIGKANSILAVRFRVGVIPERAANVIGGLFAWLHRPVAVFAGVLAAVIGEGWLLTFQNLPRAVGQVLTMPAAMLLVFCLAVASTAFHEVGHASACRYCGIRPGKMGCGLYVIWPVFYTDINDTYRLSRAGRLRTDLGGLYFNGLFIAALAVGYWLTGFAPLAVAVVAIDFEIIQQLLPAVRFDAYYIVSDLIGVPDLFRYIGPMAKRVLLRAPSHELKALKRWPKVIIGIWVFGVVPVGIAEMGMLIRHLPSFAATGMQTASALLRGGNAAAGAGDFVGIASALLQMLSAILPLAGIALLVLRALIAAVRLLGRLPGRRPGTVIVAAAGGHAEPGGQAEPGGDAGPGGGAEPGGRAAAATTARAAR